MRPPLPDPDAPIDYWRAIARRGVLALRFKVGRFAGETWMGAAASGAPEGLVRRAAHAAIALDKTIALETSADEAVRRALADALEHGSAPRQASAYQAVLIARLWGAIQDAPAQRLAALAAPHED
ncbi:hypothetical protein [Caulobacter sp.]|uniref:hypothetical protein n=1 Tax=Caulobacter sp. TaxID=78 RepID=UPI001B0D5617|nr:hypothetical protein [Caulobacter sp.]MBO9547286.1 hypothetical protein [Caulobacter sp.]